MGYENNMSTNLVNRAVRQSSLRSVRPSTPKQSRKRPPRDLSPEKIDRPFSPASPSPIKDGGDLPNHKMSLGILAAKVRIDSPRLTSRRIDRHIKLPHNRSHSEGCDSSERPLLLPGSPTPRMSTRFLNGKNGNARKPSQLQLTHDWSKSLDESALRSATRSLGPTVANVTTTTGTTCNQHHHNNDDDNNTTKNTNNNNNNNNYNYNNNNTNDGTTTTDVYNTRKRETYTSWRFALPHIQPQSDLLKHDHDDVGVGVGVGVGDNKRKSSSTPCSLLDSRSIDAWPLSAPSSLSSSPNHHHQPQPQHHHQPQQQHQHGHVVARQLDRMLASSSLKRNKFDLDATSYATPSPLPTPSTTATATASATASASPTPTPYVPSLCLPSSSLSSLSSSSSSSSSSSLSSRTKMYPRPPPNPKARVMSAQDTNNSNTDSNTTNSSSSSNTTTSATLARAKTDADRFAKGTTQGRMKSKVKVDVNTRKHSNLFDSGRRASATRIPATTANNNNNNNNNNSNTNATASSGSKLRQRAETAHNIRTVSASIPINNTNSNNTINNNNSVSRRNTTTNHNTTNNNSVSRHKQTRGGVEGLPRCLPDDHATLTLSSEEAASGSGVKGARLIRSQSQDSQLNMSPLSSTETTADENDDDDDDNNDHIACDGEAVRKRVCFQLSGVRVIYPGDDSDNDDDGGVDIDVLPPRRRSRSFSNEAPPWPRSRLSLQNFDHNTSSTTDTDTDTDTDTYTNITANTNITFNAHPFSPTPPSPTTPTTPTTTTTVTRRRRSASFGETPISAPLNGTPPMTRRQVLTNDAPLNGTPPMTRNQVLANDDPLNGTPPMTRRQALAARLGDGFTCTAMDEPGAVDPEVAADDARVRALSLAHALGYTKNGR